MAPITSLIGHNYAKVLNFVNFGNFGDFGDFGDSGNFGNFGKSRSKILVTSELGNVDNIGQ